MGIWDWLNEAALQGHPAAERDKYRDLGKRVDAAQRGYVPRTAKKVAKGLLEKAAGLDEQLRSGAAPWNLDGKQSQGLLGLAADTAMGMAGAGTGFAAARPGVSLGTAGGRAIQPEGEALGMYARPPGDDPRYLGAAPDRSDRTYLRYTPKKLPERLQRSLEALRDPANPVRQDMLATIDRGNQLGGSDWYNTEELRDWFVKELGEDEGDREWRDFMWLMGSTSPGSNVDANLGNASAVRRRLAQDPAYRGQLEGLQDLKGGQDLAKTREKGYGHKTAGLQELNTARLVRGDWEGKAEPGTAPAAGNWTENPKPKGFAQSLLGNKINIAADLHFTRYMAMASRHPDWLNTSNQVGAGFRDRVLSAHPDAAKFFAEKEVNGKPVILFNAKKAVKQGAVPIEEIADEPAVWEAMPNDAEYGAFEGFMKEVGDELGMTPAQAQAALWMGAADRTGLDPLSQGTFMELLRKRADKRAKKDGLTREEVLRRFVREKGLLAAPAAGALGASHGLLAPPEEEERF